MLHYSFSEVLSTRRYRSDSNQNYLDMKLGNLMVQKIVRIETDQVMISFRLIECSFMLIVLLHHQLHLKLKKIVSMLLNPKYKMNECFYVKITFNIGMLSAIINEVADTCILHLHDEMFTVTVDINYKI